jgi:CRISPR-associated protein Csb2
MFALGIHYLTGYATATDSGDYGCVEWPPHPARVFMAMVAAHHEGCTSVPAGAERAALLWLEALPPPAIGASHADSRTVVEQFVPVNDSLPSSTEKPVDLRKRLPGAVGVARSRQARSFPKARLQDPHVFLIWPETDASPHVTALARLCAKVTRIGHSSSLVQMWIADSPPEPDYLPASVGPMNLRVTCAGFLDRLEACYNGDAIEAFFDLSTKISITNGKAKKSLRSDLEKRFRGIVPTRQYPLVGIHCAYIRTTTSSALDLLSGPFDPNILILAKLDGPVLGLESTGRLTTALRGTILKKCFGTSSEQAPEWLTGHAADGKPASSSPHIALLPLAFVGHEHADGHLLGMAIAFPRLVAPRERGRAFAPLFNAKGAPAEITLTLGELGTWTLVREDRSLAPHALRAETWCRPSHSWTTVTPVVLERHIKSKTPESRYAEISESIAESCERVGLPRPIDIDIDKNAFLLGSPRSSPDKSGFPLLVPDRQQIHVWLRFPSVVEGPVMLGAGRYRGYGFLKPVHSERRRGASHEL